MSRKSSVKVTIVGEEYTIRSDEAAEHTRAVAKYVDEAIRGVMNAGATVESHKAVSRASCAGCCRQANGASNGLWPRLGLAFFPEFT